MAIDVVNVRDGILVAVDGCAELFCAHFRRSATTIGVLCGESNSNEQKADNKKPKFFCGCDRHWCLVYET